MFHNIITCSAAAKARFLMLAAVFAVFVVAMPWATYEALNTGPEKIWSHSTFAFNTPPVWGEKIRIRRTWEKECGNCPSTRVSWYAAEENSYVVVPLLTRNNTYNAGQGQRVARDMVFSWPGDSYLRKLKKYSICVRVDFSVGMFHNQRQESDCSKPVFFGPPP
tara:strand:+ start:52394 stop:52885 length:492 start_codon:yes stop_codon:yes gene_type:complete